MMQCINYLIAYKYILINSTPSSIYKSKNELIKVLKKLSTFVEAVGQCV